MGSTRPWFPLSTHVDRRSGRKVQEVARSSPLEIFNTEGECLFSWTTIRHLMPAFMQGFIPIPKASSKERIVANAQIYDFELSEDEVKHLDSLDEGMELRLTGCSQANAAI